MTIDNTLPVPVEHIESARLPQKYEAAKAALAECERVDECAEWANRAEALASYARQANDTELENTARRIRDRAVRRCGELLLQVDGRGGSRAKNGSPPTFAPPNRRQMAAAAGLTIHQQITASGLARIPEQEFEKHVESPHPPGTTALAKLGRQARSEIVRVETLADQEPPKPPQTVTAVTLADQEPPKPEKPRILSERDHSPSVIRQRAGEALNLLLRLEVTMTDPKAVVDLVLEGPPMNLSKVRTVLLFAQKLHAALAKAGAPI